MDGPIPSDKPTAGQNSPNHLDHDEAVSLRPSEPQVTVSAAQPSYVPPATEPFVADQPNTEPEIMSGPEPASSYSSASAEQPYDVDILPQDAELVWTASEFAEHPKSMSWYLVLGGIAAVLVVLGYLFTRDIFTIIIIAICAGIFGYTASRQPRQLSYALSSTGITIGGKFYAYKHFSGFAVVPEGHFSSIDLLPLQRFAPMLSIYFDPNRENQVMGILSEHLPLAHHQRNAVDGLMHKIRF